MTRQTVGWGFLGNARITRTAILPLFSAQADLRPGGRLVALASRHHVAATETARQFAIPKVFDRYEDLLKDPDVSCIYCALPNHLHAEWTLRAVEAGKHVLCEKPIALTACEAEAIEVAAAQSGVVVQEALMIRSSARWIRLGQLIRDGAIGEVNLVQSRLCFYSSDPNDIRNRTDCGGGALLDAGVYLAAAARFVFGEEPTHALSLATIDTEFGTDSRVTFVLRFRSGEAHGYCGTRSAPSQALSIVGARGRIDVPCPILPRGPSANLLEIMACDVEGEPLKDRGESFSPTDQYAEEMLRFEACVRGEVAPALPLRESVATLRILDAVRKSWTDQGWVALAKAAHHGAA